MVSIVVKCLCLLMMLMECSGILEIFPSSEEIEINEKQKFEINCSSDKEMKFIQPGSSNDSNLSNATLMMGIGNNTHKIYFKRDQTMYDDTGFYGCYNVDDEKNGKNIYLFVKSEKHFFSLSESVVPVLTEPKRSVILSCRPTSRSYTVKLFREKEELDINIEDKKNGKITFDNKKGFQIHRVNPLYHTGEFSCSITHNGETQNLIFDLQVRRNSTVHKPLIDKLPYIVANQTVRINCSVPHEPGSKIHNLEWKKVGDDRTLVSKEYRTNDLNIRELEISNITYDNSGKYQCITDNNKYEKTEEVELIVHDPNKWFIELSTTTKIFQPDFENNVQWVVQINAYPQPEITWYDPYGKIIPINSHDDKYHIENENDRSLLKIFNLAVSDNGNYTMRAKIRDSNVEKNASMTVRVPDSPVVREIGNVEDYYMIDDVAKFYCYAEGWPVPTISWLFEKSDKNLTNKDMITQQNHEEIISQNSTVEWRIKSSGFIICRACHKNNCSDARWPIFLTDVPNGFGILEPKNIITVGDYLEIPCAASIYNFTEDISWYNDKDSPLISTDKITIINDKTSLSYISKLIIKSVPNVDKLNYSCVAKTRIGQISKKSEVKLVVNNEKMAYFIETNMNETEIIHDNTELNPKKLITLKCIVGGFPPPSVNWYKDNINLIPHENKNSSDSCEINYSNNNQILTIKYLTEKCSGEYKCIGKNRLNEISMKQKIIINNKQLASLWIIGLILLFVMCLLIIIYSWFKLYKEKLLRKKLIDAGMGNFEKGELLLLNPALTIDNQAELLPYDKKWEFPNDKLKLGKQLGSGAFGVVVKADAYGILNDEPVTTVAVKMTRKTTDTIFIRALSSELKIMIHLGKHINVVNLLGACTKNIAKRELYVIVEYCPYGNLHNFLLRNRNNFINQIDDVSENVDRTIGKTNSNIDIASGAVKYTNLLFNGSNEKVNTDDNNVSEDNDNDTQSGNTSIDGTVLIDSNNSSNKNNWEVNYCGDYNYLNLRRICTKDLILWAFQVARGMEYLSQRKVLHGDLAARNILLTKGNVVKICDFGLAKNIYDKSIYTKKSDSPLPIKWMAIESIKDRIFSTQSDVWSFGIVLWEFFSLGATPYPGMEAQIQYEKLIQGYRMEKPAYSTDDIYQIMLNCWHELPKYRQSFTEIVDKLSEFLDKEIVEHYINLNIPYLESNTQQLENGRKDYLSLMTAPDHEILSSMIFPDTDTLPLKIYNNNNKRTFKFPINHNNDEDNLSEEASMIDHGDKYYLRPINIHDRRLEFERMNNNKSIDNNDKVNNHLNYYNTKELDKILQVKTDDVDEKNSTKDLGERRDELSEVGVDCFSNPSYMMIESTRV